MTASISMSVFHQWLLADPASKTSACAIILHIADSRPCELLIQEISDYLNEYDDDGDGRWLPASPELVDKIARDPNHRRLLGLNETSLDKGGRAGPELHKTLSALGLRGHVVFRSPGVPDETLDLANTFHAGVGTLGEITDPCHLILNPALMDQNCIAHVIGDVFLEWLHCETRRNAPIQDIR
ncbi:MAG: hypothetical protein Q8Q59_03820 [Luteolibacter sp.]|jgi:hypothetical protein|nr:hypothetical protein [Luteolibacter sp.]